MKTTRFCIIAAATLTVGAMSFTSSHAEVREVPANTQRQLDTARTDIHRNADGMVKKDYDKAAKSMAPDAEGIGDVLAQVTQASLTTGGFDDLIERFVDADRNRMGRDGFAEQSQPELDRLAKSLNEAWKAKYNQEFNMNEAKIFSANFAKITQSEIGHNGAHTGAMHSGDRAHQDRNNLDQTRNNVDPNGNTNTRTDTARDTGAEVTTRSDGTMTGPTGVQGGVDMTAAADQQRRNESDRTATPGSGAPERTTGVDASRAATDMDGNRSVVTGQTAPDAASGRTAAESTRTGLNTPAPVTDANNSNTGVDAPDSTSADRNLNDPGRNTAVVTIPASHGLPELKINMIHEAPDMWKIDVPDSVDGPRLQQNLIAHLNACQQMQDKWPTDVNEAYRAVSHHVLMAIHNMAPDMAASTD